MIFCLNFKHEFGPGSDQERYPYSLTLEKLYPCERSVCFKVLLEFRKEISWIAIMQINKGYIKEDGVINLKLCKSPH